MTSWAGRPGTRAARAATASSDAVAKNEAEGPLSGRSVLVPSLDPDGSPKTGRAPEPHPSAIPKSAREEDDDQ